ncbi:MAG: hypothetical protein M1837_001539 [Sclerophora amabilis]|nr:MAG: hypothetical protein M1837_001539 [Sclerophora amabilis]
MADLLVDTELDEEQQECAENIQRSANGLLTVINDILDFSKVESGRLDIEEVQFSLSVVIRDVCKMLGFAAERKNLSFESDVQVGVDKDLIVMGDPGRVRQIVTNLLTNSIKFTSDGYVKLEVMAENDTKETITIKFVVEDTGIGIEEDIRKRLFRPFSQADSSMARRFGGTGLGLTICKNLVDLMHGEITLESTLGSGTRASFSIPFSKPQYHDGESPLIDMCSIPTRLQSDLSVSCGSSDLEHAHGTPPQSPHSRPTPSQAQRQAAPGSRSTKDLNSSVGIDGSESKIELNIPERNDTHVLIVEDNAINQQIALKTVKKLHFSASAVWNGKEALDYLRQEPSSTHRQPDIILMDVQMPVIDGYRATHLIRHHPPLSTLCDIQAIPIVAMTASAIQGDKEKCKRAGMDDYLSKPVKAVTLERMLVKWVLEGRRKKEKKNSPKIQGSHPAGSSHQPSGRPETNETSNTRKSVPPNTEDFPKQKGRDKLLSALTGIESEGDRGLRRVEAEEKATSLRDGKLLAASDPRFSKPSTPSLDPIDKGHRTLSALTEENIHKLESHSAARSSSPATQSSVSSVGALARDSSTSTLGSLRPPRPSIGEGVFGGRSDSSKTITALTGDAKRHS